MGSWFSLERVVGSSPEWDAVVSQASKAAEGPDRIAGQIFTAPNGDKLPELSPLKKVTVGIPGVDIMK